MNTRGARDVSIKYTRRKMALDLDLNLPLAAESSSDQMAAAVLMDIGLPPPSSAAVLMDIGLPPPQMTAAVASEPTSIPLIDVDAIDDEVLLTSPRAFAEAKTNSRRTRVARHTDVVDVDVSRPGTVYSRKRFRKPSNLVINCEQYINLESTANSKKESAKPPEPAPPPPPPPTYNCPICLGQLQEETTTKCGHIFCKSCIKTAISVQKKCPMCKKKVNAKDIIRVYLPSMG